MVDTYGLFLRLTLGEENCLLIYGVDPDTREKILEVYYIHIILKAQNPSKKLGLTPIHSLNLASRLSKAPAKQRKDTLTLKTRAQTLDLLPLHHHFG